MTTCKPRRQLAENPTPAMQKKLTEFAHLYRGGPDEVRGDAKACYKAIHPRSSDSTAEAQGSMYLNHRIVQAILAQKAEVISEQADITQARVLQELAKLAFFDIRKLLRDDGTPKPISELDDDTAGALSGLDVMNMSNNGEDGASLGQVLKYRMADKKGALELIGKNLKMWTDKVEADINGGQSLSDLLKQARDESE